VPVEVEPPGIAASLGKQLELPRDRMIAPNSLLKGDAANVGCDGAALGAIEPTVGPPLERVCEGVGIVHAQAGRLHFRMPIRNVVAVAVGVEQKVGRLGDKNAAVAKGHAGRQVQSGDEVSDLVKTAVPSGIFVNGNSISAARAARRRLGNTIVDSSE